MEQVFFTNRSLEASWVNSGSFVIADLGEPHRRFKKKKNGGQPKKKVGKNLLLSCSQRTEIKRPIIRKTNKVLCQTGAASLVITPHEHEESNRKAVTPLLAKPPLPHLYPREQG